MYTQTFNRSKIFVAILYVCFYLVIGASVHLICAWRSNTTHVIGRLSGMALSNGSTGSPLVLLFRFSSLIRLL